MEANLVAIDYQIRQLRDIQPVTPLFNSVSRNQIEHKDKIVGVISEKIRDIVYSLTANYPANKLALYLSVIQVLIFKYTAQEEFVVATGALNQDKSDSLIFSRFNPQKLITFKDLLKITRSHLQEGYRYQSYDVEALIETFLARDGNPATIFDIALIQEGFCSRSSLLNNFQLVFAIDIQDTSVSVTFPNNNFHRDFVERMLGHFRQILETVTANPDCELSEIDILTTAERYQLLTQWNDTQADYPQDKCLHQLFEEQVERNPDAVAVRFENQQLTYQQLNQKANQLAHYLQTNGVKPETLVGICIERSLEMVVGLLGILKAGGAYLPLDPKYPKERLNYILQDTGVTVLLTQRSLTELLPEHQVIVLCLDADWPIIAQHSQQNTTSGVAGENLAYVIYTSGSTGKPKGAMNTHKGISNRLLWMQDTYQLTPSDRILQKTPFSFDVSVWEFFWPLLAGATLVVAKPEGHKDSAYLIKLIQQQQITTIHFVPSMLRVFLQEPNLEDCSCLKRVICSGEALPYDLKQHFFERLNCELHNLYGPTEAAIDVTYWQCLPQIQQQIVPIGRPIANTQIYILDQYLQPVPIGITGELHIGGVGLARGYLNRPELTAEKFISYPFSDGKLYQDLHTGNGKSNHRGHRGHGGIRVSESSCVSPIYKTGDLARYLPDGNIEYLGRIDHQVKIRGFRIELGEIETVLSHHPAVEQAVVIAYEEKTGNQSLIGYIVANSQRSDRPENNQFDEQVEQWQMLYNQTYSQTNIEPDSTFNIVGWNSSYTGQSIPADQMREWLNDKVKIILSQQPNRVLEIGCGTGLILFQIAPHCRHYWATDISPVALEYIQQQLSQLEPNLDHVHLLQRAADNFENLEAQRFDTIILNSVVQYFPNIDYLLQVLEGAVNAVAPGGCIFLGDVRNLQLQEAFHASVELHKALPDLSVTQWQQRVQRQIDQENELLIDPAFFAAIGQRFPQITHVEIHLQRGQHHNELTQFRYNVLLYVGDAVDVPQDVQWIDWQKQQLTLSALQHLLEETQPEILGVTRIPNARLVRPLKSGELLKNPQELQTVSQLRAVINAIAPEIGVEPDEFSALAEALSYSLVITWSDTSVCDYYDVIFIQRPSQGRIPKRVFTPTQKQTQRDWRLYANQPLQPKLKRQLIPQLRSYLETHLPEYMMPNAFVMLDAIPLTANGKIDRRALPSPEQIRLELANTFVPPCTPIEEILALIWAEVLGIEQVGIHDNFFELGGDSIRGIQAIAKARQMGCDFSLPQLFQHQTIQELASLVSQELSSLPTQKTEAFSLISEEQRLNLPEGVEDAYPLAALQAGMVFHSEYSTNVPIYHDVFTYHIRATLNIEALHSVIKQVVNRHPVLRTSFAFTNYQQPLQLVYQQVDVPLNLDDLSHLSTTEQELALDTWIEQEKTRHFDWNVPPLLRFHLHRRSSETFNLTLSFHHSILDGWSVASLLTELLQQYLYILSKNVLPLPAPPTITFRDFVALEQITLKSQECQEYWQQQLSDMTITKLPRWSKSNRDIKNWDSSVFISSRVSQGLKQLSKATGVPLKSVLLAAHLRVLSFLTNQTDILTGLVSNGRLEDTDGERVLGLFLNTLPFRLKLLGGTWTDLVRQTFDTERECLSFRRYPLAELQRNFGGEPLFETAFNFIHFHVYQDIIGVKDLEVLGGKFFNQTNFTLVANFSLHPISSQVELILKYDGNQLGEEQIKMIGGYYQEALTAIASQGPERYEKHCLLSDREQHRLLVAWNDTHADYAQDKCIHQLFAEQVERSPDAVAVVFENQQLTYRQLNERANQLAHYLQTQGVKPEVLVGICVERSPEMIIGMLAILKAGGAYLPLDPAYPQERLSGILTDAKPAVLLTQKQLIDKLGEHQAHIVCLDSYWHHTQESQQDPICATSIDNLVYVIYTSGSTGRPKGVQITHAGLLNLVCWHQDNYQVTSADRATQLAGVAFDAAVWEIWPYLTCGASVYLPNEEIRIAPLQLRDWLVSQAITISFLPTPLAESILLLDWPKNVALRTLLTGGDKLHHYPANSLPFNLVNNYGPTENTVVATSGLVPVKEEFDSSPAIGRPIANTQIYLLDANLQPVPIGAPGELHISGAGLARNYLNRPDLTNEKFIANPFSQESGARLYKTGDLARYLDNGEIEYLGRIDHQVKIHGFRIELGEIETVLNYHPAVEQAVVILPEDIPGNKRLVAYVVTQNQSTDRNDLRRFLQQKLPDYMIPSAFVFLEALPLTPNGKVDRKMLPLPEAELTREQEFVPPQTSIEQILATIWEDVLRLKQVSRYDKFFEIGGDSILSIQVVGRARQAGIKITPRQIFQYPTLAELAAVADTATSILAQQDLVTGVVPLTPIQHWFFEQNRSDLHHFNQSVLLQVPSHLKPELLSQAISKLLEHHDALRLRFVFEEGKWQQTSDRISDTIPFQVIDLSPTPQPLHAQTLEQIATTQQASLDLSTGPLIRVVLFQLGNNCDSRLLIIIHHLAVDGVSWRILLEDLFTAYQQLEQQETIQLPLKTLAFQDWAMLLQEYGKSEVVRSQLNYWLKQPWSEVNSLPVDHPTGKQNNSVASIADISVNLSQEQTRALLQKVPSAYNTQINDVLLTALVQTLAEWTGKSTVLLDLEGHGREDLFVDVDISRTVGWFTSIFPVVLQLPNQNHLGEALKSIKEQLRAIPQRGIGYGILRYLSQEQEISAQIAAIPLREISFNYLGQFDQGQGLELAPESKGSNHSLKGDRTHLLDITARVIEGQLQVNWSYSRHIHQNSTVELLAQKYLEALLKLIDHCLSSEVGGYTPSDFPVANLNQQELDEILAEID
ncbi:non-ribosomal peptide synthetase [Nostoc sp. CHAB 5836]|uniref:non-ribosomal peptide synthetase n=1 Tax=Nostoc sp. CHAB 5836 TaxID=2780404 RepID=UPI001E4F0879|nr:non-ribosomal peptide synthetase [Nostoc sp. CHAB 5836]